MNLKYLYYAYWASGGFVMIRALPILNETEEIIEYIDEHGTPCKTSKKECKYAKDKEELKDLVNEIEEKEIKKLTESIEAIRKNNTYSLTTVSIPPQKSKIQL